MTLTILIQVKWVRDLTKSFFGRKPQQMVSKLLKIGCSVQLIACILLFPSNLLSYDEEIRKNSHRIKNLKELFTEIEHTSSADYKKEIDEIERTYYLMINRAKADMPPPPNPRDMFETQYEYATRIAKYKKTYKKAEKAQKKNIRKINNDFNLRYRTSKAEVTYLKKKLNKLDPIVRELETLQNEKHVIPEEKIRVILYRPEPDKFRFPIHFIYNDKKWTLHWDYSDKDKARKFWKYKSYLKAEKMIQLEWHGDSLNYRHTAFKVYNTYTKDSRDYPVDTPQIFDEILKFKQMKDEDLPAAELMVALKNVVQGPVQGMDFIFISPRSFTMGSPRNEPGRWANEVQHKVTLTKGFYIQTTEVTQAQWRAVMGHNPSENSGCGSDCPVENVFWGDVMEFINRLNQLEKTNKYRLPTEAEWEYACRAGDPNMGAYGSDESRLDQYAWYKSNSGGSPHPVASKRPNNWGLFDMHGNVSEWCSDWFGVYPGHPVTDPGGPYSGKFRVARGGNWFFPGRNCRAADRNANLPGDKSGFIGVRIVKSP